MIKVSTDKAPAAIGPYSQAVKCGDFLFTSGQIPLCAKTGEVVGTTIKEQAEQVMKNMQGVLESQNLCFTSVVKTTCFLADMADFATFNEVYAKYFTGNPARSCVAVKTLPKNVLCEVEAIVSLHGADCPSSITEQPCSLCIGGNGDTSTAGDATHMFEGKGL